MQPPKILFLTPGCFDKGGISRYSRYQMAALVELFGSEQVRTLSVLGPTPDSFEDPVDVRWTAHGAGPLCKAHFALRVALEALLWKPDVIHTAHVNLSGLAFAVARLVGARTILNVYGLEVWSGLRRDALFGLRHSDVVLSDCHATADYLLTPGHPSFRTDIPVIWDCVDLLRFNPGRPSPRVLARYGLPDPACHTVLMTLGRVSQNAAHKGYERLLLAFARVADGVPALHLVIAGDGDLREPLRRQAAQLGVGNRVTFTGSVREADLPDVYRAASIFSLVTDRGHMRGEGIPLTPLEAMACGAPILVGSQDGSREAVESGRNGFILDPVDPDALVDTIRELATNEALRDRMSAGAVGVARERFSYDAFRQKHASLYERLIG